MTLEEIKIRMLELDVDREWLAKKCGWTKGNIVNILAPKGSNRSLKAIARISEVLEREVEERKIKEDAKANLGHRVFLEPTKEQFDKWMRCAYAEADGEFDAWAKAGLDAIADAELPALLAERRQRRLGELPESHLKVAEEPEDYGSDQAAQ